MFATKTRLFLLIWLVCVGASIISFYSLRALSDGREFTAPIIIAWEKTDEGLACHACDDKECLSLCENLARGIRVYTATLGYTERIFRSRVGYAGIAISHISWSPSLINATFSMPMKDNGTVEVASTTQLKPNDVIGVITYSVEFFPSILISLSKILGAMLIAILLVPLIIKRFKAFQARFPKLAYTNNIYAHTNVHTFIVSPPPPPRY